MLADVVESKRTTGPHARYRVMVIAGTRPEAIKLAPLILQLKTRRSIEVVVCVTAQHRRLLDEALALFGIKPDIDLDLMRCGQDIQDFLTLAITSLKRAIAEWQPQLVVVQGDTATALAGAQTASDAGIPVAHVEAGLRSGDLANPFPEEMYRRVISRLASLHFAPTVSARDALLAEGISAGVHVTGNTGIDALNAVLECINANPEREAVCHLDPERPLVLVTAHRRESFGMPLKRIVAAIHRIAAEHAVQLLIPVHPNPAVRETFEGLRSVPNICLAEPFEYPAFLHLLRRARLILTDSGGIQEEAPALGVPVIVMRDTTERLEGVVMGNALLAGTDTDAIAAAADRVLRCEATHARMSSVRSPYGDGHAARRIASLISDWLDASSRSAIQIEAAL